MLENGPRVYHAAIGAFLGVGVQRERTRSLGLFTACAFALAGCVQSLFFIGPLIGRHGTAAIPLLICGWLLAWAATPGWTELVLMWPRRVGGVAAACAEALRPYSPVLSALVGTCYWWGWVPTSGLLVVLSSSAIHQWLLPAVRVEVVATIAICSCALLTFFGIKWGARLAMLAAGAVFVLAFLTIFVPIVSGHVDWHRATTFHLVSPFPGWFGNLTSLMAGLYLIGHAAPAFEAAMCYAGETKNPARTIPRVMLVSAAIAGVFFIVLPVILLGTLGPQALERDLAVELGRTYAPLFGSLAKAMAIALMFFSAILSALQPLAGASRTISQLAEDGVLPRALGMRLPNGAPWAAALVTAEVEVALVWIGSPIWLVAAANFTYLISICIPSITVWMLRRAAPDIERPYRAPAWSLNLGLFATAAWLVSAVLGIQQFGLVTVILGLIFAYAGAGLYAWRRFEDRYRSGAHGVATSLYLKLTGAMMAVLVIDGSGYLIAIRALPSSHLVMVTALQDIFVAVAFLTVFVGLVLPGTIAHAVMEVNRAAGLLVAGTVKDFTVAVEALGRGDIDAAVADVDLVPVRVLSRDEIGEMAASFNRLQAEIGRAAHGLADARAGLRAARAELVRAKEDAEAANIAKGQFLAKMSHELRTPMNGVLSTAELLLASDLSERQRRLATIIHRSGGGLLELINEILDHSKLEAGKINLEAIDFYPCEVMEEAIEMVAEGAADKQLELRISLPPSSARVNGDPVRLRQVVTNLLSNAIKFTSRGTVAVEAALHERPGGVVEVAIVVRDTGVGITNDYKQRLFDMFSQADDATTRKYGGTGLGLAIVKQIVDLFHGEIAVDSAVGKGTTFTVRLPMAKPRTVAVGALRDGSRLAGMHCLVVDDPQRADALGAHLEQWQMIVTKASSQADALALLGGDTFPIAIISAQFGESDTDGLKLIERMRAEGIAPRTAITVTSGVHLHGDEALMKRLRISDWLYRPVRQSEVYNALVGVVEEQLSVRHVAVADSMPVSKESSPGRLRSTPQRELRILVAEDNPVNQEVTSASLDYLGYTADVVEDGAAAVAAYKAGHYDLILMDCHMPRLDGFDATLAIRQLEAEDSRHRRVPVIAVSANAMKVDTERCLECGMDDHLAKPFRLEDLRAKLDQWLGSNTPAPAPAIVDDVEPAIDLTALERIAQLQRPGRPDVVARVVNGFEQTTPTVLDAMETAISGCDFQSVRADAHKLKSSSANVGALRLSQLFRDLEGIAGDNNEVEARAAFGRIQSEYRIVCMRLSEYMQGKGAVAGSD